MRHFLRSILAVALIALAAACQNEPPHEPVKPKPFAFENKQIKHTELSLDIAPEDKELEYVVLFAEKKHFIANGIFITHQQIYYRFGISTNFSLLPRRCSEK